MKTHITNQSVEHVISRLQEGIDAAGMRIVAHINGQANAAKMGIEVPADQILEVFRPDYAIQVWKAHKPAGHDIPLRIHVYEDEGKVNIACRMPSEVFAPFNSAELDKIGEELDGIFTKILEYIAE